jgi:hypothetical protein
MRGRGEAGLEPRDCQAKTLENANVNLKLPTKRWWSRQFPPRLVALWIVGASLLTFASSLIPRPVYSLQGLEVVRYGYPMPFLTQDRSGLAVDVHPFPVFVTWVDGEAAVTLEWRLAVVNVAFYLVSFALARVLLRPARNEHTTNREAR